MKVIQIGKNINLKYTMNSYELRADSLIIRSAQY